MSINVKIQPVETGQTIEEAGLAISVKGLSKTYRNGVQALAGVSFNVRRGEIFGLLGPNGAGKSTTVRILATLTQPDSGQAVIAGHDVSREPDQVRQQFGYVAQTSGVDKYGTGRENLTLQAQLQRVPARQIPDRVAELLVWVGLTEAADRLVNTYSGGMKRRLDLAMGLVHEPGYSFLMSQLPASTPKLGRPCGKTWPGCARNAI
jgi:ABC-2 type transport system ATP-binding protein